MNCEDLRRLLDESDTGRLTGPELAAVEQHVAGCGQCADQCLASSRMAAFRTDVPPLPDALRERVRRLKDDADPGDLPAGTRRPVIIASLLLLGSAATLFGGVSWRDPGAASR